MEQCKDGKHSFVEILRKTRNAHGDAVARWCEFCGAVVVDFDCEQGTVPGAVEPMRFPQIAKDLVDVG